MIVKAAIYARCATSGINEDRIGPQFLFCERFAEAQGFTIVNRFFDRDISGATASRPAYKEMLAAARRHEFGAIIAEDLSRFWRNHLEMSSLIDVMDKLGVVLLTHDCDSRNRSQPRFFKITNAIEAMRRTEHSARIKRGLEGRRIITKDKSV